jgi:lysozyme family protein
MPDIINNNARIGDTVFQNAVDFTLRKEGVLSDDKNDHGGVTKYGITIPFLTDFLGRPATKADILALTAAGAVEIYHEMLWVRAGIGKLPAEIAGAAFDFAVNIAELAGPTRSSTTCSRRTSTT